ncbi:UvrD-helicase domain-containing protein, partial [Glutamicibacter creatinolyticus]
PSWLDEGHSHRGEGALMAALREKRTGRMGDIVGTIQAEQDAIIRSELAGAIVVQGGPGTGKTAVALHRAAYLLYEYRERLKNAGVLIVGPSTSFMRYIERVLPSLGETGVVMASVGELYAGVPTVPELNRTTARVKGELSMARVIAQAVRNRQRLLPEDRTVV